MSQEFDPHEDSAQQPDYLVDPFGILSTTGDLEVIKAGADDESAQKSEEQE